jgi:hypothetical protein
MLAEIGTRSQDRAMTSPVQLTLPLLLAAVLVIAAACAPSTGSLGTPAAPAATEAASAGPGPSDVLPSETTTPTASPTAVPPSPTPGSPATPVTPATQPTAKPLPTATPAPAGATLVRTYFMLGSFTDNGGLVPVLRTVPETKAVARAAMMALLEGPNTAEMSASPAMYTSIPDGTRLIDVSIADGVATVNLSSAFKGAKANFQEASAMGEIVYTLTQFSTVKLVRVEVEGVRQGGATGRSDYQDVGLLPAIFVDRPAWGAALGNPGPVSGLANVFEATFRVQVLDAKGKVLADKQVMASCGTGCWGTFKTSVSYTVAKGQYGTLRVFDLSAKDGTPENVTEYRVWLTP